MFSLATPSMSERHLPPHPMHAMLSLSEGAMKPRPSTCRGTMVKAAPAATPPTNCRRDIARLRDTSGPSPLRYEDDCDDQVALRSAPPHTSPTLTTTDSTAISTPRNCRRRAP